MAAIPTILKGDDSGAINITLASGRSYIGATLVVAYQGVTRSFTNLNPGQTVALTFTHEETATFSVKTAPILMRLIGQYGAEETVENAEARIKVTDCLAEVNAGGSFIVTPGQAGSDPTKVPITDVGDMASRYTIADLQAKVNQIVRVLAQRSLLAFGGVALLASAAFGAVQTARLDALYNDSLVVTNVTDVSGEDTNAVHKTDAEWTGRVLSVNGQTGAVTISAGVETNAVKSLINSEVGGTNTLVHTDAISNMATKTWVGEQGYLTTHQSLEPATNYTDSVASGKQDTLTDYTTTNDVKNIVLAETPTITGEWVATDIQISTPQPPVYEGIEGGLHKFTSWGFSTIYERATGVVYTVDQYPSELSFDYYIGTSCGGSCKFIRDVEQGTNILGLAYRSDLASKADTTSLANYLALTGGKIQGNLSVTGTVSIGPSLGFNQYSLFSKGTISIANSTVGGSKPQGFRVYRPNISSVDETIYGKGCIYRAYERTLPRPSITFVYTNWFPNASGEIALSSVADSTSVYSTNILALARASSESMLTKTNAADFADYTADSVVGKVLKPQGYTPTNTLVSLNSSVQYVEANGSALTILAPSATSVTRDWVVYVNATADSALNLDALGGILVADAAYTNKCAANKVTALYITEMTNNVFVIGRQELTPVK